MKERITHAAVQDNDDTFTGKHHEGCMMKVVDSPDFSGKVTQDRYGFVTDSGRFIDRKEAFRIGIDNGQIDKRMLHPGRENEEAFSEMFWMEEIYYGKHDYDPEKGYFYLPQVKEKI